MSQPKITLDQVRHVATLARLALDEQQLQKHASQLESILEYVGKIQTPDVTGVEPMAHAVGLRNVFREDVIGPSLPLEQVLRNAAEIDGSFFKVPKIIGAEEDSAG